MTDRTDSTTRLADVEGVRLGCVLVALVLLVMVPVAATATTAQSTNSTPSLSAEPAFVVALDADGSARVTLVTTFDLTTESERIAFEALRANETAREQRTDRFATRMRAIAAQAENDTGRDMAIRNPAMTFTTENGTGIVGLSVTWDGLAAQKGNRLVLREPFASGFDIDRPFRVVGPDGYALDTATPTPTSQQQNSATWSATTQFEGFETVFAPAAGETVTDAGNETSGAGAPGFGIGVAVVAVLTATTLLVIRRRRK
ncbi:MAG: PGF-CTERM sorting domain-containing protein [Halodesulfurarchaeum sp.]